ncbi:hypothetical protein E5D57_013701 [Metarhizium anisopliae]|nr:hypothetical protein E5D57_013701 [Metarhizium anisopliae]
MLRSILMMLLTATAYILPGAGAIEEVDVASCMFATDFFTLSYTIRSGATTLSRCFADAGEMEMSQRDVVSYSSGNNKGWFDYEPGDGYLYRHSFNKSNKIFIHGVDTTWGRVVKIHID